MNHDSHLARETPHVRDLQAALDAAGAVYDQWGPRVREAGLWSAWKEQGQPLREARDSFLLVGNDPEAETTWRSHALVNAANALAEVGRVFEALDFYERADRLHPSDGMVRGNRGMLLARLMPHLRQSHETLAARALSDLDFAIGHPEHLHEGALAAFERARATIAHHAHDVDAQPQPVHYADPYAAWAVKERLLLSTAVGVEPAEDNLDRTHLSGLVTPLEEFSTSGSPIPAAFAAINAIKRDYLSARFAAWLALENPDEAALDRRSRTAYYIDTLDYAKWDLRSGLAAMAFASATNLTDKIATFLVLWLKLPRDPDAVNDRNWCFVNPKPGSPVMPEIDTLMSEHAGQMLGLLGLIDLAREEASRPRADAPGRRIRNASVHRFLSVRYFSGGDSTPYTEAVSEDALAKGLLETLRLAQRMYLQSVLAVSQRGGTVRRTGVARMSMIRFDDRESVPRKHRSGD